jgi:hypothetical protein
VVFTVIQPLLFSVLSRSSVADRRFAVVFAVAFSPDYVVLCVLRVLCG